MGMIVTHFCRDVVFCLLCGRDSGHVKEANIRRTFDFNRILSLLAFPPNRKAALQITVAISDMGSEFRTCGAVNAWKLNCSCGDRAEARLRIPPECTPVRQIGAE